MYSGVPLKIESVRRSTRFGVVGEDGVPEEGAEEGGVAEGLGAEGRIFLNVSESLPSEMFLSGAIPCCH